MTDHDHKRTAGHDVALWAGVAAFFGSLATIGAIEVINPDQLLKLTGSLVVAAITAGGVYSKQRLDDAKVKRDEQQRPAQPD